GWTSRTSWSPGTAGQTRVRGCARSGSGSGNATRAAERTGSVPGVDRLVAVHALAVLQQGRPERVVPVLPRPPVHPVDEPARAVDAEQAALLDDPQQPVTLVGRDTPRLEAGVGHRQQCAEHQL